MDQELLSLHTVNKLVCENTISKFQQVKNKSYQSSVHKVQERH